MGKTINDIIEEQRENPPSIDIMGNIKEQIFNEPVPDDFEEYSFIDFIKDLFHKLA